MKQMKMERQAYRGPKAHQIRSHNTKAHIQQQRDLKAPSCRAIRPAVNLRCGCLGQPLGGMLSLSRSLFMATAAAIFYPPADYFIG